MSNYVAIIARIDTTLPIDKADKIQIAKVLGESVVVSKDAKVGDVGVFFCAGTQLSNEYCHENNLFRDATKNYDTTQSGFFEATRRVRAQPFLKVKSEGYFAALESLSFAGDVSKLKLGDKFEEFDGVKICNKYINEKALKALSIKGTRAVKKVAVPFFKEHVETSQFRHNTHQIEVGDLLSFQSKRHGTSGRYGYLSVEKNLPSWKKLINKILPVFKTAEYEYVVGTRRVILESATKEGYHGTEGFRFEVLEQLKPYLTKGMTIYTEIVGYANTKPIMPAHSTKDLKNKEFSKKYGESVLYKYGCVEGTHAFHIYRITLTTEDGNVIDLTQPQLVKWCKDRGLDPAHDVAKSYLYDGNVEALISLVEGLTEREELLTEDYHDQSHPSEGVIVRVDRGTQTPLFLKSKSYVFKVMEGILSEKEVDIEDIS